MFDFYGTSEIKLIVSAIDEWLSEMGSDALSDFQQYQIWIALHNLGSSFSFLIETDDIFKVVINPKNHAETAVVIHISGKLAVSTERLSTLISEALSLENKAQT